MKLLSLFFVLLITLDCYPNCLPDYQADISKKSISRTKLNKVGKISTITAGTAVGGFYGTMAIILIGPWWSFVAVGGPFAVVAALPVGTTFFIISKIKKNHIKKRIDMMNLINMEEATVDKYYQLAHDQNSTLTKEQFKAKILALNNDRSFCNGSLTHKNRLLALPKEFLKIF